jgi:Na+-transporting methylmalonyl-CoA/oxaloacetate decarboxylase gamma subunit
MNVFLQAGIVDRIIEGGKYSFLGFATVLAVLALICGILSIFGLVFGKKKETKPVAPSVPEVPVENTVVSDDGAIVAAITAAISAILAEEAANENREPDGFRVVSFKRAGKNRK